MKIAIGSDHAGFSYKQVIIQRLKSRGIEILDFGTHSDESCDYPDFVRPAAQAVANGDADCAIVLGGTGNGEAIVANKVKGIRCALCWNLETARLARAHNDANVIAIGERTIQQDLALQIIDTWLDTKFEGGRHIPRIQKIEEITC